MQSTNIMRLCIVPKFSGVSIMFLPRFQMWFDASGRAYVSLAARYDPLRK